MKLLPYLISLALGLVPLGLSSQEVKVAVSDTLNLASLKAWESQTTDFEWQLTGSVIALRKLNAGLVDAAMVLKSDQQDLNGDKFAILATGGCFLAVHEDNPLKEISLPELVELLRPTQEGSRVDWGEIVDDAAWSLREVYWSFRMDEDSAGHLLWNHFCFPTGEVWPERGAMPKASDSKVLGENYLLVLDRLDKLPEGFRFLAVKLEEDGVAFSPSLENIFYEDYPLVSPLLLVVRKDEDTTDWVHELYGSEFGEILEQSDYSGLGEKIKKQSLLVFDKGS